MHSNIFGHLYDLLSMKYWHIQSHLSDYILEGL